jgi:hypothetical protein
VGEGDFAPGEAANAGVTERLKACIDHLDELENLVAEGLRGGSAWEREWEGFYEQWATFQERALIPVFRAARNLARGRVPRSYYNPPSSGVVRKSGSRGDESSQATFRVTYGQTELFDQFMETCLELSELARDKPERAAGLLRKCLDRAERTSEDAIWPWWGRRVLWRSQRVLRRQSRERSREQFDDREARVSLPGHPSVAWFAGLWLDVGVYLFARPAFSEAVRSEGAQRRRQTIVWLVRHLRLAPGEIQDIDIARGFAVRPDTLSHWRAEARTEFLEFRANASESRFLRKLLRDRDETGMGRQLRLWTAIGAFLLEEVAGDYSASGEAQAQRRFVRQRFLAYLLHIFAELDLRDAGEVFHAPRKVVKEWVDWTQKHLRSFLESRPSGLDEWLLSRPDDSQ